MAGTEARVVQERVGPPRGVEGWPVTEIGERLGGGYEHKDARKLANLVQDIRRSRDAVGCRLGERRLIETARGRAVVRGLLLPR